jgi:glutamine amidotransferase
MKTIVVDYGIGNLHSVVKALRHEGADVDVSSDGRVIATAERLVLPGVGAFADGMTGLRTRDLIGPVLEQIATARPFLGICLGMQLLLGESEEFGHHVGLRVVPGRVVPLRVTEGVKVPHVGWNAIQPPPGRTFRGTPLEGLPPSAMMYFVHSFAAAPAEQQAVLAEVEYGGGRTCAAVHAANVLGCQFHPEKSGAAGLGILRRFLTE